MSPSGAMMSFFDATRAEPLRPEALMIVQMRLVHLSGIVQSPKATMKPGAFDDLKMVFNAEVADR